MTENKPGEFPAMQTVGLAILRQEDSPQLKIYSVEPSIADLPLGISTFILKSEAQAMVRAARAEAFEEIVKLLEGFPPMVTVAPTGKWVDCGCPITIAKQLKSMAKREKSK